MTAFIVGGTFDNNGGKPSRIISELAKNLNWGVLNGGSLDELHTVDFTAYKTLLWMPNISNEEDKILPHIKSQNQKLLLISSKRVVEKNYTAFDVVTRLLKSKSNLGIMITQNNEGRYQFQILDPLGNSYITTEDITDLALALTSRVQEIQCMTRVGSQQIGNRLDLEPNPQFLEQVLRLGDLFSQYVNAINPERFLGNASTRLAYGDITRSTRCCHGFPAERQAKEGVVLVSRRNVDKQNMTGADFVAVSQRTDKVEYYGDTKPSVDTPIQLRLFEHFNAVNYIIHGHVYVEGAPFTRSKVPCGHIEEFKEITDLFPIREAADFTVNLKGHGCLMLARDVSYFNTVKLSARPFPEI